jgi:hypothetical protein
MPQITALQFAAPGCAGASLKFNREITCGFQSKQLTPINFRHSRVQTVIAGGNKDYLAYNLYYVK